MNQVLHPTLPVTGTVAQTSMRWRVPQLRHGAMHRDTGLEQTCEVSYCGNATAPTWARFEVPIGRSVEPVTHVARIAVSPTRFAYLQHQDPRRPLNAQRHQRANAIRLPWILLALLLPAAPTLAVERTAVSSIRPLLLAAIENGQAHGVLTGSAAPFMNRMFKTVQPMEIDVAALHDLAQAGCKRLQVTTTQKGVVPDARARALMSPQERQASQGADGPRDIRFAYQISFCRNGTFPTKGAKP